MTSTINEAYESDPDAGFRAAVLSGAASRFRAVILTSLTTLGGVFPRAYGIAGDAGWLRPMVLAVGWGLLFATVLTLLFIPCLLMIVDDVRRVGRWVRGLFRRRAPEAIRPEPRIGEPAAGHGPG
jgi:multidrug efflux pump subunit AcrB